MIEAPATFVDRVRPDGVIVRWESRHHRKHQKPAVGSTWWAPKARGWWIAILFAIGSLLFAIGSVPGYASAAGAVGDTVTYFVGSLFFTTASFLSYREAVDAAPGTLNPAHRRFFVYQPRRIDWWATGVQLVGTLYFNVSTGVAMVTDLSAQAAHQHVWRPDAIGSVCFLVSSALAWYEICHGWAAWRPRVLFLVDHAAQPGRVDRLRHLRRGRLHQPGDRPGAQRRASRHADPDRRGVLPHRRRPTATRTLSRSAVR